MFLLIFIALAFNSHYHFRKQRHVKRENNHNTQLSCVEHCMKDRKLGRITVEKREKCGEQCQNKLNLPVDENDDSK